MNYEESMAFLKRLGKFGIHVGLERSLALSQATGNPEMDYPIIHVAGTNGKGSVSAMIDSILRAAGFHVGLYTSPHLSSYNERIRIGGRPISKANLSQLVTELKPVFKRISEDSKLGPPTEFEMGTAIAFLHFAYEKVDFAVVEVGLGGRLDSTNIIKPKITAITNISLEHTDILGKTLKEIAMEKAGIIKQGVPVVIGNQNPQVSKIIEDIAKRKSSHLIQVGKDIEYKKELASIDRQIVSIKTQNHIYNQLEIPLIGAHQIENTAIAVGVIDTLREMGISIEDTQIKSGLHLVSWPGRLEILQRKPMVLVDCAHNSDGAKRLKETVTELIKKQQITTVVGISKDKPGEEIMSEILKFSDSIIATQSLSSRSGAMDPYEIFRIAQKNGLTADLVKDPIKAVDKGLKKIGDAGILIIAGSIYLVGNVRKHLLQTAGKYPMNQRIIILVGALGSGKTEIALTYGKYLRTEHEKVCIVDFDIVNPYFRSRDAASLMRTFGVDIISSNPGFESADLPSISPLVYKAFQDSTCQVIFDVGGDPIGSKALRGFRRQFEMSGYDMYFVVNTNRPFTQDTKGIINMLKSIENASQLFVTGLISNTHLGKDTKAADITKGVKICADVSEELDIPLVFACMNQSIVKKDLDIQTTRTLELDLHMLPPWDNNLDYKGGKSDYIR